ncbi:uncharacterized protein LOC135831180 [Planococcus citri]|uniref:uncharacterized protein LOC135831180 n=1 Tax=Planococcus citri TaxID=170843 RepID=UPI0031F9B536
MKAGETIVIMSLLGTISQAARLLKVPRIYNAIITSDKELLPSQAFPALSPVLQSIQFPHFANTLYQPVNVPIMTRNSDPFVGQPKQYDRPGNQLSYETYAKDTLPLRSKDTPPNDSIAPKSTPVLFRPNVDPKSTPTNEENMPNIIPNSNFQSNTVNTKKPFYPHYDEEIGQIFNVVNYDNKKVYSASSPTSPDSNSPTTQKVALDGGPQYLLSTQQQVNSLPQSRPNNDQFLNPQSSDENQDQSGFVDSSSQFNPNQFQFFNDFVKNNAPKDKSIADVPPPPLPVGRPGTQRRNENAPVNPLQLAIGI